MPNVAVFTYGTLEFPEVMEAVTGREFDSVEATTEGYARYLLKGRIYPGMTPVSGQTTSGRVYFGISQQTLELLDDFEDDMYVRQLITVRTHEGHEFNPYAFIIQPKDRDVLSGNPWIRETFVKDHLESYLTACRKFYMTSSRSLSSGSSI